MIPNRSETGHSLKLSSAGNKVFIVWFYSPFEVVQAESSFATYNLIHHSDNLLFANTMGPVRLCVHRCFFLYPSKFIFVKCSFHQILRDCVLRVRKLVTYIPMHCCRLHCPVSHLTTDREASWDLGADTGCLRRGRGCVEDFLYCS